MIPCGAWLKSEMIGKIPDGFELGCFNQPIVENPKGDPTAVNVHVEPFYVMSRSKHPRQGVDFLRFITSRRMAGRFARMQDSPTAVRGTNAGNLSKDMDDLLAIIERAKTSYGTIPGEGYPDMQQVYNDEMFHVIGRDETPEQIAGDFERRGRLMRIRAANPDQYEVHHVVKPILLLGVLGVGAIIAVSGAARGLRRSTTVASPRKARCDGRQRLGWGNALLFLAPAVLVYSAFVIWPSLRSFAWSLHRWNGLTDIGQMPFTGLLNFKRLLLESDGFWIALQNNLFLMLVVPAFVIPLALFLATCLSRGVWGANVFRVVFFFPNLIGGVAATLLWLHLYNPKGGVVNHALVAIGLTRFQDFPWLGVNNLYWALIPISIWGACGFNMVLYLAAMQSVPEDLYESATIDGASQWRQFWTITLPMIWDMLAISIVFMVIGGMKAFETIWLLTNQQPVTETHVVGTLMVQSMFNEYKVGEATAIAVLLFLMVFIGTGALLRIMKREAIEV
jgi:ABC-type sugar transport system permease subunit